MYQHFHNLHGSNSCVYVNRPSYCIIELLYIVTFVNILLVISYHICVNQRFVTWLFQPTRQAEDGLVPFHQTNMPLMGAMAQQVHLLLLVRPYSSLSFVLSYHFCQTDVIRLIYVKLYKQQFCINMSLVVRQIITIR